MLTFSDVIPTMAQNEYIYIRNTNIRQIIILGNLFPIAIERINQSVYSDNGQ